MATSTVQTNNQLTRYQNEFIKEWYRENRFSPYMGKGMDSIIRVMSELKQGGEQLNIPMLSRLRGTGVGAGTLVGNEESLDDYGMRGWIDWSRNAVTMKKNERHKQSADAFAQVRPLLRNWADELMRDEIIEAFMALPSTSSPAGLGSDAGDRVNGVRYEDATAAQRNTWNSNNSDRVLYGNATANYNATHATALANIDTTNDLFTTGSSNTLAYVAKTADPKIKPYKVDNGQGREYFVCFHGSRTFRDLQASLDEAGIDKDARARERAGMDNNPLFQGGDELYRGVIHREVPEIDDFAENTWTTLSTASASSGQVYPVFFCGQSAMAHLVGQMPRPTFRKEDDYDFITSAGIESAYGIAKLFKAFPKTGTVYKQTGVVTGFFAASTV